MSVEDVVEQAIGSIDPALTERVDRGSHDPFRAYLPVFS